MTDYSFYEQKKKLSRGAQAKIRGTRLVFERAGGLGTECGLMAPVHPLGGLNVFLQDDEKS